MKCGHIAWIRGFENAYLGRFQRCESFLNRECEIGYWPQDLLNRDHTVGRIGRTIKDFDRQDPGIVDSMGYMYTQRVIYTGLGLYNRHDL